MTAEQILKLVEAGFTKAEITQMIIPEKNSSVDNTSSQAPEEKPASDTAESPAPLPATPAPGPASEAPQAPGPDPLDDIRAQISELNKTIATMSKSIISPSLADVKPLGVEDVLTKFFKEN